MRHLPPLNALRAYEAAARHSSFQAAAEELHVTPSAVSHQIKSLEAFLGVSLFRRLTRRVALTPQGRGYLPAVRGALDQIDEATAKLLAGTSPRALTVRVSPTFATEWLVPRLAGFQAENPGVDFRLTTSREVPDFDTTDIDVAIPYGTGPWPGLEVRALMGEELVVVCSPALLDGPRALRRPEDLAGTTLLHVLQRPSQWADCLRQVGVEGIDTSHGASFQSTTLAMEAAMSGLGAAIANRALVGPHLAAGRLAIPFELDLPSLGGYHLVHPRGAGNDPRIRTFEEWIARTLAAEGLLAE